MGSQMCGAEQKHDEKPVITMMKGPSSVVKEAESLPDIPTSLIERILIEINMLRKNPRTYANKIASLYTTQIKGEYHAVSKKAYIEGADAFREAERVLASTPGLPPFMMEDGLRASTYEHLVFLSQTGTLDTTGRGGTTPLSRMERFGQVAGTITREIVAEFQNNDPVNMVCELLADDGIIDRRNRLALLNPRLEVIGVAISKRVKEYVLVIDMTQSYSTDPSKCKLELLIKSDALSTK